MDLAFLVFLFGEILGVDAGVASVSANVSATGATTFLVGAAECIVVALTSGASFVGATSTSGVSEVVCEFLIRSLFLNMSLLRGFIIISPMVSINSCKL